MEMRKKFVCFLLLFAGTTAQDLPPPLPTSPPDGTGITETEDTPTSATDTPRISLDETSIDLMDQTTSTVTFNLENLDFTTVDYYAVYVQPETSSGTTDDENVCTGTNSCVTLWKAGAGVDGTTYFVVGDGSISTPPASGTTASGNYPNLPLKSGYFYKIAVKARSAGNVSYWAATVWTSTYTKPPTPTNVVLAQDSSNPTSSLTVSWNIPADSTATTTTGYYLVVRDENGTPKYKQVAVPTATSATVGGLTPGLMYEAYVTSYVTLSNGKVLGSDYSDSSNIVRSNPLPPTMLVASQSCSPDVTVTLTSPATGDFYSYNLHYNSSTSGTIEVEVGKDPTATLSLSSNTLYTFVAYTISDSGSGEWTADGTNSTPLTEVFTTYPDVVTNLKLIDGSDPTAIQVTFTVGNATKYAATVVGVDANGNPLTQTVENTTSPITVAGLTPGGQFTYSVTSYNSESTPKTCKSSETGNNVIHNTGLIVGVIFAVIIAVIACLLGWWFCWTKQRSSGKSGMKSRTLYRSSDL